MEEIKKITRKDIKKAAEYITELKRYLNSLESDNNVEYVKDENTLRHQIDNNFCKCIGIYNNEKVKGVCVYELQNDFYTCKKLLYISVVYVPEEYRGNNYGKKLMDYVINKYKNNDTIEYIYSDVYINDIRARKMHNNSGLKDGKFMYTIYSDSKDSNY